MTSSRSSSPVRSDHGINTTPLEDTYGEAVKEMSSFRLQVPDPWHHPTITNKERNLYGNPPRQGKETVNYADIDFKYFRYNDRKQKQQGSQRMDKRQKVVRGVPFSTRQPVKPTTQENTHKITQKDFRQMDVNGFKARFGVAGTDEDSDNFIDAAVRSMEEDKEDAMDTIGASASTNQDGASPQTSALISQDKMDIDDDGTLSFRADDAISAQATNGPNESQHPLNTEVVAISTPASHVLGKYDQQSLRLVPDKAVLSTGANSGTPAPTHQPGPHEIQHIEFGATTTSKPRTMD